MNNGNLPKVSYVIAPAALSEHPSSSPLAGEQYVKRFVDAIGQGKKVWEKTVILWTFDENGGFFDHVVPPSPPPGTPDEFIYSTAQYSHPQNIGLGFRVPAMVISPWSAGGKVASHVYDHTSILQFIEKRWGAEIPYLIGLAAPDLRRPHRCARHDGDAGPVPDRPSRRHEPRPGHRVELCRQAAQCHPRAAVHAQGRGLTAHP